MPQRKKTRPQTRQVTATWRALLALGIVAVVSACVAVGLWEMSPRSIPAAVAEATPTAMATATSRPTYTATPSPSPTLPPATPSPTPQPVARQKPFTLTLLHTNDTWGYTQPCGWQPQKGGVARRATFIQQVRAANESVLVLDAGDCLYGDRSPANVTLGASSVEVMNMMGYDAIALGAGDMAIAAQIASRIAEARFPVLSANAAISGVVSLVAEPYVLRQFAGQTVAIVGLTEPFTQGDDYAGDPVAAAEATVEGLASQASVIILLSHAGADVDAQIAHQVPGIDVIVSGGTTDVPSPRQDPVSGTVLLHAETPRPGLAGTVVGQGTFQFDAQGDVTRFEWTRVLIGQDLPEDPEIAQWVAQHP